MGSNRTWHKVPQEATRLGVSESWLYEQCRRGVWPHRRVGGRVLVSPSESDAFLDSTGVDINQARQRAERAGA